MASVASSSSSSSPSRRSKNSSRSQQKEEAGGAQKRSVEQPQNSAEELAPSAGRQVRTQKTPWMRELTAEELVADDKRSVRLPNRPPSKMPALSHAAEAAAAAVFPLLRKVFDKSIRPIEGGQQPSFFPGLTQELDDDDAVDDHDHDHDRDDDDDGGPGNGKPPAASSSSSSRSTSCSGPAKGRFEHRHRRKIATLKAYDAPSLNDWGIIHSPLAVGGDDQGSSAPPKKLPRRTHAGND